MCTIDVCRKQAAHEVSVPNVISVVHQNTLLERPINYWSDVMPDFRRVPDNHKDLAKDFSKRTSLGSSPQFMQPFREALFNYDKFYEETGTWGKQEDESSPKMVSTSSPFDKQSDPSFAQKLKTEAESKVIFIGDIHSSFHSFIEVIQNLIDRGIFLDDLSINPQYYVIFLGDIFDRGPFGLDIINIIFRIKNRNFDRVFVLNGNHEDRVMYNTNGTGEEIKAQLPPDADEDPGKEGWKQKLVHDLMRRLPAVIFLYFNNQIIQLCHGGIAETYSPKTFLDSNYTFDFHGYDHADVDDLEFFSWVHKGLRWTDFSMAVNGRDPDYRDGRGHIYGIHHVNGYLGRNGLAGIIRGHQDMHHASLLPKRMRREDYFFCSLTKYHLLGLKDTHPFEEQLNFFERQPIPRAFDDFSVFTTSTAVWSRPGLGYYNYMELKTDQQAIKDAQEKIQPLDSGMMYEKLTPSEIAHLKAFSAGDKALVSRERYGLIKDLYKEIKENTTNFQALFPVFELLSYDPFTYIPREVYPSGTTWRKWLLGGT